MANASEQDEVECPACGGSGYRQFSRGGSLPRWIEREVCTTCNESGIVDATTAATVRELMDAAERREAADYEAAEHLRRQEEMLNPPPPPMTCGSNDDLPY